MSLPTFEQFQNGNTGGGKSKLPSFSTFLQTYEKPIKEKTKVGKALSTVGNFGKEIAKDGINSVLVKPAARATEALTRLATPNSLAAKGYRAMADEGQSQKFAGMEVKPIKAFGQGGVKQIAGEALQTASWLYGGAEAKAGVKALTKTAELAAKKTFAEIAVKQIPELLKIGFVGSSAATIGNQLEKTAGTNDKIDWNQAIKDITIGTLATPVVGMAIAKVFGTKASKILEARQALRDAEVVANKIKAEAMPIGTKFDNVGRGNPSFIESLTGKTPEIKKPNNLLDNTFNPTTGEKITPKVNTADGAYVAIPEVKPTTPKEVRAVNATSKEEFIANEIKFLQRTQQKIPANIQEQASKTWDKMHPVADTSKITKTSFDPATGRPSEPIATPKTEVKPTEAPKIDTNTPEFKQKVKENFDTLNQQKPEEFNAKTHEIYANEFTLEQATNPALAEAYATGRIPHPKGAAFNDAFNALLTNEAQKTNNVDLIDRLSDSSLNSISGQKLEANKMRMKDSSVDLLKKVKNGKLEGLPKSIQKIIKREEAAGKTEINRDILTFKPTPEITSKVLDSLICT